MSLRRKVLCAVPLLLGCWTLKPGGEVPDGGAVRPDAPGDVVDATALDASADVVDAARDVVTPDTPDAARDVVTPDIPDAARDVVSLDAPDAPRDVVVLDTPNVARDVVAVDTPDAAVVPTGLRLVGPPGLATVTGPRPTLRWNADVTDLEVVVCTDRSCTTSPIYIAAVSGRAHTVAMDLPPDMYFWHLRRRAAERVTAVWQMRVARNVGALRANAFGTSHRDMDNDGYADIAIGAPGPRNSATPGAVYVFRGGSSGPSTPLPVPNPSGQSFGWDLAWGDFNGDDRADLAVASFDADRLRTGTVTVLQSGGTTFSTGRVVLSCSACGTSLFASSIATGDTDGDGLDDIFAANPQAPGRVLVWRGANFGPSQTASVDIPNPTASDTVFGTGLAVVGDIDGDGFGDLVAGAPCDPGSGGNCVGSAGRMHLYFGGTDWGARGPTPITVLGPSRGYLGAVVAPLGDVNDDGYADFAVSGADGLAMAVSGVVRVYLGGPRDRFTPSRAADATLTTATGAENLGSGVAGVDLNADGLTDVLAGAPGTEGALSLLARGRLTGFTRDPLGPTFSNTQTFTPGEGNALIGLQVAAVGDTNGDGYGDWVATAPAIVTGSNVPDTAYLWFGGVADYTRAPDRLLRSGTTNQWLGRGLAP